MANDGAEIDLYAEDIEFNQDSEFNDQNVDLYDDVITPSKTLSAGGGTGASNGNNNSGRDGTGTAGLGSSNSSSHQDDEMSNQAESNNGDPHHQSHHSLSDRDSSIGSGKKIGLYVGNLTWWTTDQDILTAVQSIGVYDIQEVKFFENRANGQSKGFCLVSLGSDSSVRAVLEKLPKTEIHAQNPLVTMCSKQNLNHFEMQSRKNQPGSGGSGSNNGSNNNGMTTNGMSHSGSGGGMRGGMYDGNRNGSMSGGSGGNMGGNMMMNRGVSGGGGSGHNMGPPMMNRPQRQNGPMMNNQQNMRGMGGNASGYGGGASSGSGGPMQQGGGNQGWPSHNQMGGSSNNPNQRGGPMHGGNARSGGPIGGGPMGMRMNNLPAGGPGGPRNNSAPLLRAPGMANDGRLGHGTQMNDWDTHGMHGSNLQGPQGSMGGGLHSGPAPHVNPAFFGSGGPSGPQDHYSRGPSSGYGGYDRSIVPGTGDSQMMLQITEAEFEELMNKNRTVSTNAISRAVSDAAAGDCTGAIETLVTAISLIKQSKVAGDDRCKFLISSLQDTLQSIEAKAYTSSRKERPRSRDRERSRERSSRREKSRRDRSRSRDYRERSYEGRRSHDEGRDRYRERDRDRDRERDRDHREHRSRH